MVISKLISKNQLTAVSKIWKKWGALKKGWELEQVLKSSIKLKQVFKKRVRLGSVNCIRRGNHIRGGAKPYSKGSKLISGEEWVLMFSIAKISSLLINLWWKIKLTNFTRGTYDPF